MKESTAKNWLIETALTDEELLHFIISVVNAVKTQEIASPVFKKTAFEGVKEKLNEIASSLRHLESDVSMLIAKSQHD